MLLLLLCWPGCQCGAEYGDLHGNLARGQHRITGTVRPIMVAAWYPPSTLTRSHARTGTHTPARVTSGA